VAHGRLHLEVQRVRAGPLPLPTSFLHGVADTISRAVNDIVKRNEVDLLCVTSVKSLIRITAQAAAGDTSEDVKDVKDAKDDKGGQGG
jgi:hypothetical protein